MTRITHRPQPSGAMTVDSAREPARRAVDAAIGLSATTEKAKATLRLFADSVATGGMITVNHATSAWTEGTVNGTPEPFVSGTDATFVVSPSTSPPCATSSISACHHRSHQG